MPGPERDAGVVRRLFSQRVGAMLVRNTVVGTGVFLVGLAVLWLLVNRGGVPEVPAAGIGFVAANSLHYLLGRKWIFRGTERGAASGYALFLLNAGAGLAITMGLYALALAYTHFGYIGARILVSVVAGLVMFVFNAVFNFRRV